ncbi:Putative histidinol-phosphate aminotransferase [Sodalis praecaptivus]|uniref:histidinol-phosphate transaminase n=1 Tax=Sodalis praecaptivus TaxID=1239307 RepID=W0HRJ9_9GAMM|nr:histidinol-phosphate transaminase [Sodalis praecaptivus]AHF75157.1 Putative histidinol-phosphate aminotransferase [Sodalis praecaptivus]
MTKLHTYNTCDRHIKHRLHLNETDSTVIQPLQTCFEEEFARISIYPDPENRTATEKIAHYYRLSPDQLLMGNGVDEIILLICLTFLQYGGQALLSASTFPGYQTAARLVGGHCLWVPLDAGRCDLQAYRQRAGRGVALAFLCNPHNPTGTVMDRQAVTAFIECMNRHDIIPIVDEAYIHFAGEERCSVLPAIRQGARAIMLRTFSKAFGLAGIRVGFAAGPADVIAAVARSAQALPFRVNRFAQRLAAEVLTLGAVDATVARVRGWLRGIMTAFDAAGIPYMPSAANFICFKPPYGSEALLARAQTNATRVRDCAPFGMPGWIRASIGHESDRDNLLALLRLPGAAVVEP